MHKPTVIQFQYDNYIPLGALYLTFGLEKENIEFDLKLFPFYKYGYDLERLYFFLAHSGDIVAVGCLSDMLPYVIAALDKLKKEFPEKIVILGGVGPTEVAEEIITTFDFINFIIKGCGVYLLPKLIKKIQDGSNRLNDIGGLVYQHNNGVISNYYKGFYLNIPDLPPYYYIDNIQLYDHFYIFTSFGCPYLCTFCHTRPVLLKKVVYRNLNEVMEEIKLIASIKKYEKFHLSILDEAFVINKKRVLEFCNLLRAKRLNISWDCYGRVDAINEELLKIMSKSSCVGIYYGIESGSNAVLKEIKKGFTIEEAIKTLLLSKKYIKKVVASFIYLFPFEKPSDFYFTKAFVRYLISKGIKIDLHSLTPAKNSEIYLKYKKYLFISKKIHSNSRPAFNSMPRTCVKLIRKYPDIFYYYYSYNFEYLDTILKMAEPAWRTKLTEKNNKELGYQKATKYINTG
jgi:anaerobic magnesium-protoporphyrin IX monomethyl ester cyclase